MNPDLTPEQKQQLANWSIQRDGLLLDISNLRDEKFKLEKTNKELAESSTKIIDEMNKSLGRIEELNKKEAEYENLIDLDLAQNISTKTTLDNIIPGLQREVASLESQKESLIKSIEIMQSVNSGFAEKNIELEKQIGGIIELSAKSVNQVNSLMETLKVSTQELIDINKKNVKETEVVIEKVPRLFFDLERRTLETQKVIKVKHK